MRWVPGWMCESCRLGRCTTGHDDDGRCLVFYAMRPPARRGSRPKKYVQASVCACGRDPAPGWDAPFDPPQPEREFTQQRF